MASTTQSGPDPVLDLLGKMETQISRMEGPRPEPTPRVPDVKAQADSPELRAVREELAAAEQRGAEQLARFTEALGTLRTQIPELVEEVMASRFLDVEERFYNQVREIQQRTMDSFLQSAQGRVGVRIAALEATLAEQTAAMAEMRENHQKSDRNIDRLLNGLDRLTAELMRLSTLAGAPVVTRRVAQLSPAPAPQRNAASASPASRPPAPEPRPAFSDQPPGSRRAIPPEFALPEPEPPRNLKVDSPSSLFLPVLVGLFVIGVAFVGWQIYSAGGGVKLPRKSGSAASVTAQMSATETQLKTASDFAAEKDYVKAESIYRSVLKSEPENRTAIKELASMLFKQQKYEEAAAALKSLPPGN